MKRARVKVVDIENYLEERYSELRKNHPKLHGRASRRRRKKEVPEIYNWPGTREQALTGIAMCDAILELTHQQKVKELVQDGPDGKAESLYRLLENTDFWTFCRQLGLDEEDRKRLSIECNLVACYVWPKKEVQLIYITHPEKLLAKAQIPGATAIVGAFTIGASERGDVSVRHAEAFYLLGGGKLDSRSHWESKYLGINENELVIHCRVAYKRTPREYEGVISLKRTRDSLVIGERDSEAKSVQAYRGEFGTLGETDIPDVGQIYCEQLAHPLEADALERMFETFHKSLLARLNLAR